MRHILPPDLPESAEIIARLAWGDSLDCLFLQMLTGEKRDPPGGEPRRSLGHVKISDRDLAQDKHYRLRPTMDFHATSRLLHECEEQHQHQNWNLPRYQSPTSLQLIDVEDMMVISATTQHRYIALSYVWGEQESFESTTTNRESLGQRGGLFKHMDEILQTIKDAMDVVRNLGERYLWVDRLCIEQDNAAQKVIHIGMMDVIYSHALVTIIAHAGIAATSPLPGLRPGTRLGFPRKRIGEIVLSVLPPNLWDSDAPHETRGWTLQEQLMSKRCLYFDYHKSWFQCNEGLFVESDATRNRPYDRVEAPISFNMRSLQSTLVDATDERHLDNVWDMYSTIVERYRTRKLRYAEDTINAIQGVTQVISNFLDVPLISAVPSIMLPRALQFHLKSRAERNEAAPSWSWAGWRGPVYFHDEDLSERMPFEEVKLEMKVGFKAYTPIKTPIQGVLQTECWEAATLTDSGTMPTPLYILLNIECSSTKASVFRLEIGAMLTASRIGVPIFLGTVRDVFDQQGKSCGQCHGTFGRVSEEDYCSDDLKWILLSRSQPHLVSL